MVTIRVRKYNKARDGGGVIIAGIIYYIIPEDMAMYLDIMEVARSFDTFEDVREYKKAMIQYEIVEWRK